MITIPCGLLLSTFTFVVLERPSVRHLGHEVDRALTTDGDLSLALFGVWFACPVACRRRFTGRESAMNDEQADRIARLLEDIRDGQRLQLERQAQAIQRQEELLAQQRARLANVSEDSGKAKELIATSARVVASARILVLIALPLAVLLIVFLVWVFWAQVAR